jgi:plastocyanin
MSAPCAQGFSSGTLRAANFQRGDWQLQFHCRAWRKFRVSLAAGLTLAVFVVPTARAGAPLQWLDTAGSQNNNESIQITEFLANDLTIDAGDRVKWTVDSGEFHTVSLLPPNTSAPSLIATSPAVCAPSPPPCFNPQAVTPSGGTTFDNTTFVNSGLLTQGQSFTVTFSKPGTFIFQCLVHAGMVGTLHVQPAGTPYPHDQRFYDTQATIQKALALGDGARLQAEGRVDALTSPGENVTAGIGDPQVFVPRFLPGDISVKVGQTVEWTNRDPATPHTVTFGQDPPGGDFGAFPPIPGPPGSATISSTSQNVNSGFLGAGLPFGTTFKVTFTAPGDYQYHCVLHDDMGMHGVVHVHN